MTTLTNKLFVLNHQLKEELEVANKEIDQQIQNLTEQLKWSIPMQGHHEIVNALQLQLENRNRENDSLTKQLAELRFDNVEEV